MNTSVEHMLTVRSVFCRSYHFPASEQARWVTQAFPVLSLLTDGEGTLALNERPGEEIRLKRAQPFLLPANLKRRPHPTSPGGYEVLAYGFQATFAWGIDLFHFLKTPMFFDKLTAERLCEGMLELVARQRDEREDTLQDAAARKRIQYGLVEVILAALPVNDGVACACVEQTRCLRAVGYLNENFRAPLDLSRLTRLCGLSRTHFFRLFKKQIGSTPFDYVKNRRIQEAQNMLLGTDRSIGEIGGRAGWPDPFHFSRMFKREVGLSPTAYRRQFGAVRTGHSHVQQRKKKKG